METEHVRTISFAAAFIAGIAGSMHCFVMCGVMAGALGMRARSLASNARAAFVHASLYQLGRIGGYTLAGILAGALGATALQATADLGQLSLVLRVASGLFIALVGVRLLVSWNPLAWIERAGAHFWQRLRPLAQRTARQTSMRNALALGFLWGWLPCGLVYSMLLFAGMSGSVGSGGGIMLAFGIGTLPSMLTSSLLASQIQRLIARRWPRLVSGAVLVAFGAWMILAALQMQLGHHAH
jgi:sulfite exporter TauE/SafE